jgi:hypothetical protein
MAIHYFDCVHHDRDDVLVVGASNTTIGSAHRVQASTELNQLLPSAGSTTKIIYLISTLT